MNNIPKILVILLVSLAATGCEKADDFVMDDRDWAFSSSASQVLFISRREDNSAAWHLYRMNNDGSRQTRLSGLSTGCRKPVISNWGSTVMFTHKGNELYAINADGSDLRLIDGTEGQVGSISWSHDDKRILYFKEGNAVIYDMVTGARNTITYSGKNSCGIFTHDNRIIFGRRGEDYSTRSIYIMTPDGTGKRKLIDSGCCPVLSPDGKTIAYNSAGKDRSRQIFTADITGENIKQLTSSVSPRVYPGWPPDGNEEPVWTPDGKRIVYVSWENELPDVYIMNRDGKNKKRLTDSGTRDESPVVTSDGRFIVFTSRRDSYINNIYYMTINGNNQTRLSDYPRSDVLPVIVPY